MSCICCGLDAGFNRVIVHLESGATVASLCRNCELENFGSYLEDVVSNGADTCTFCDEPSTFALPTWEPILRRGEHVDRSEAVYELTPRTVSICESHWHHLQRL